MTQTIHMILFEQLQGAWHSTPLHVASHDPAWLGRSPARGPSQSHLVRPATDEAPPPLQGSSCCFDGINITLALPQPSCTLAVPHHDAEADQMVHNSPAVSILWHRVTEHLIMSVEYEKAPHDHTLLARCCAWISFHRGHNLSTCA